jgi:hypothetical protein
MGDLIEGEEKISVLTRRGVQPTFDILEIAAELSAPPAEGAGQRVLLDWSFVERWLFKAPTPAAISQWKNAGPLIQRAAILHTRKCDQQAAVVSALLRLDNAEVRSFPPSDRTRAIGWLQRKASS